MLFCRALETQEICSVYQQYLVNDFLPEERKPLDRILTALQEQKYWCFGCFEGDTLVAYAFFVGQMQEGKRYFLLDYFAVIDGRRGEGIGSQFLRLLQDSIRIANVMICEVNLPSPDNAAEMQEYHRRMTFYERGGFVKTGVTTKAFGVPYVLLEYLQGKPHTAEKIREAYGELYRIVLPETLYQTQIQIF